MGRSKDAAEKMVALQREALACEDMLRDLNRQVSEAESQWMEACREGHAGNAEECP